MKKEIKLLSEEEIHTALIQYYLGLRETSPDIYAEVHQDFVDGRLNGGLWDLDTNGNCYITKLGEREKSFLSPTTIANAFASRYVLAPFIVSKHTSEVLERAKDAEAYNPVVYKKALKDFIKSQVKLGHWNKDSKGNIWSSKEVSHGGTTI